MGRDTYHYEARARWTEGKRIRLVVKGKLDLEVSAPLEFGGLEGFLAPGELFVASACSCYMTAFFAVAEGARLNYEDFTCRAKGTVEALEAKGFRFTRIDLYPELTIGDDEEEHWATRVLEMSKKNCLVTNSITGEVSLNPTIHTKGK